MYYLYDKLNTYFFFNEYYVRVLCEHVGSGGVGPGGCPLLWVGRGRNKCVTFTR